MDSNPLVDWAQLIEAAATLTAIIIGGLWVWWRFIREEAHRPFIETSCEIVYHGLQNGEWLVELVATLENKGKVRHQFSEFYFDLFGVKDGEPLPAGEEIGGQARFPHKVGAGSFLPARSKYFFLPPGVKAKYSYVTTIPRTMRYLILHCWFQYGYSQKLGHAMECTSKVPLAEST